jgi:predicted DNA binding CopG/RHH family protein
MAKQKPKPRKTRLTSRTTAHPTRMAPTFRSEAEERAFWEAHESTDYIDWTRASSVRLARLKPSTQTISLRLPVGLLERIKVEANRRDMPCQSLIKAWLADQVDRPRV